MSTSLALDFWKTHAEPNYAEYIRQPTEVRLAMNAALSAFHVADYVWTTYHDDAPYKVAKTKDVEAYQNHLQRNECEQFRELRDIATAHKHMRLTGHTEARFVWSATQTYLQSDNVGSDVTYVEGGQSGSQQGPVILFNLTDGTSRAFYPILESVMRMWERLIREHSL